MAWVIRNFEPIYVDDPRDNPDYDPRTDDMDCMMCPCSFEECDKRKVCYWDEVWGVNELDGDDGRDDYWRDSAEQAGWFDENGDWHPFDEESEV